jgi:hypothetical protein
MIFRLSTATLLLGIAFSAASLPALAQDAATATAKPTPQNAKTTLHAPKKHAPKKHAVRHDFVKPQVMRAPPAAPAPVSSKDAAAPVADHPPNEFHFGDIDATVHGDLNLGVGGAMR